MSLIKGIHHVALRPTYAQFEKAKTFYLDLLGLKVVRQWGDEKYPCMMISTGDNSCIEVLPVPEENDVPLEGKFAHRALRSAPAPAAKSSSSLTRSKPIYKIKSPKSRV